MDMSKSADDGCSVQFLELVKLAVIHYACDDLSNVEWGFRVSRENAHKLIRRVCWLNRRFSLNKTALFPIQVRDNTSANLHCVFIILSVVVSNSRFSTVNICSPSSSAVTTSPVAAFTTEGPQEDGSLVAHNDCLITRGRYVGAPAVQLPITTAIWGIPSALICA